MKKLFAAILILALSLTSIPAFANTTTPATLDGKPMKMNYGAPYKDRIDSLSRVPVRAIAEALGYKWAANKTNITMTQGSHKITFTGGTNQCVVDGVTKTFRFKTVLKNQIYGASDATEAMFNVTFDWNDSYYLRNNETIDDTGRVLYAYRIGSEQFYNAGKTDENLVIDSQKITTFKKQGPFAGNNTIYIPVKQVAEALGYSYKEGIKDKKTIATVVKNGVETRFVVGNLACTKRGIICDSQENIAKAFNLSYEYFSDTHTTIMYSQPLDQIKPYNLLKDSGLFAPRYWRKATNTYGEEIYLPMSQDSEIFIDDTEFNSGGWDLTITVLHPFPDLLASLKDTLKVCYPNDYEDIYAKSIFVIKEKLYADVDTMPSYMNYYGNRFCSIRKDLFNGSMLTVSVGTPGKVYEIKKMAIPDHDHFSNLPSYLKHYGVTD